MAMFPSPCGDMVLKLDYGAGKHARFGMVSVPLRGYGFEIQTSTAGNFAWAKGFRPLAGIWF